MSIARIAFPLLFTVAQILPTHAQAMDLISAWSLAKESNPELLSARYSTVANDEDVAIAKSKLLPNAKIFLSDGQSITERNYLRTSIPEEKSEYRTKRQQLVVTQPLLRLTEYYQLRQAAEQAAASKNEYKQTVIDLALKVTNAYFDILYAQEQLGNIQRRTEYFRISVKFAEQSLKFGTGTRSDLADAQAKLDLSLADEIEQRHAIAVAEKSLQSLVGIAVSTQQLATMLPERILIEDVNPSAIQDWIASARQNNPAILAWHHRLGAAEQNVNAQRGVHLPSVDLVASRSNSLSDSESTIGTENRTDSIGIQISMPLFSGGGHIALSRKAAAQRGIANSELEFALRKVEMDITRELSLVAQSASRIRALKNAHQSAITAVTGNQKGLEAGTRNIVDVLNAQQQQFHVQSQLTKALYDHIRALVKVRALAGSLNDDYIADINKLLTKR